MCFCYKHYKLAAMNHRGWLSQSMVYFLFRVPQVRMVVQALQGPLETEVPQELWEYQAPKASL